MNIYIFFLTKILKLKKNKKNPKYLLLLIEYSVSYYLKNQITLC
jgi:hypothetical protein